LVQISEDDSDQVSIANREENMGKSFKRFKQLFRSFLRSVASSENPLILFLDDIQWADHASLDVLKSIITDSLASNMLIICAYREGEISLDTLQEYNLADDMVQGDDAVSSSSISSMYSARITDIALGCFDAIQLNEFISVILEMESSSTMSLSQFIWKKTDGNPFFALNFLETINSKGLISTACNGEWNWDESQIMQMTNVSQDLASISESKMQNLPEQVRTILQMASFIGHAFPAVILMTIVYEEQDTIATEYCWIGYLVSKIQDA
jgi:predicted ATPase